MGITLVVVIVATITVIGIKFLPGYSGLSEKPPEILNTSVENLDLSSVHSATLEKHGWSSDRADAAEFEYRRFLTLLQIRPSFMLVP